jgi:uncharacterized protein with HEPN domain
VRKDADRLRDVLEPSPPSSGRRVPAASASTATNWSARKKYPLAPWREIIAMRNSLVHGYFDVDWEAVWAVVERDLAPLKEAIESILRSEGEEP